MKKIAILFFSLVFSLSAASQEGFQFEPSGRGKVVIPFKLINNLIIIPVNVNGAKLNFLLDTGVDETILFSLDDKDEVSLFNVEKIKLKGLGSNEPVEGLKSTHNTMYFPGYIDKDHDIYIVLDQSFNFSSSIGIPVNGIIGYHFFRDKMVQINYDKKKITVYNDSQKAKKMIERKFEGFDITIEDNKPHAIAQVAISDTVFQSKLLIDTGNADAVWLFPDKSESVRVPENNFDDFLGRGLSGDIEGKRARIESFRLNGYMFKKALAAFPDPVSTKYIIMAEDRLGSIGGEILKRFEVVFDYPHGKMYLRKGSNFNSPFDYNMSGIEVHHDGMTWVKEEVELHAIKKYAVYETEDNENPSSGFTFKFKLKPVFSIANVRKDSPADLAGIKKGDILISINNTSCYRYTLQDINHILKSEEGKLITVEIERNQQIMKFSFRLKSII